jgi:hypothetical protein
MTDAEIRIQARKDRLVKAAHSMRQYLKANHGCLAWRMGAEGDHLFETSILIDAVMEWLDDDAYYDELAWELEGRPPV